MFGLFGGDDAAYPELMAFLTEEWKMREKYARAFLDAYRKDISRAHKRGKDRVASLLSSNEPGAHLEGIIVEGEKNTYSVVAQAYRGYMDDLRRGRHVGTDVEWAIWAILANRSDLVESIDRAFARYIEQTHQQRFPTLFDTVFTWSDDGV